MERKLKTPFSEPKYKPQPATTDIARPSSSSRVYLRDAEPVIMARTAGIRVATPPKRPPMRAESVKRNVDRTVTSSTPLAFVVGSKKLTCAAVALERPLAL